ncbi:MAG: ABC transporter ATP-binding protein [Armatimonadota bacterium]|nr:ABC transporter ATP-binding protein [Armatimonadota bacterium]
MILQAQGLTRRFGGVVAVDRVDFTVAEGEIFGVIGPNGAGKTTLMNLISGLDTPTAGTLSFRGRPLVGLPPHRVARLGIARTFQIMRPFVGMTVRENVAIGARFGNPARHLSMAQALVRADEVLAWVGMQQRADDEIGTLTTGERKRLELARALAAAPQLLLLDEVMSGLLPREVFEVMDLVRRINGQGVTVILVEHMMRVVMTLCHRVLVLHHGKPIATGRPAEVAADPAVIGAYLGERYARRAAGAPREDVARAGASPTDAPPAGTEPGATPRDHGGEGDAR